MRVCHTVAELRAARGGLPGRVGFVPTMGALHAGHSSLIDLARGNADHVAASVFVNPAQFDNPDDLAKYPRTLHDDLRQLEAAGVNLVFAPDPAEVYPPGEPAVSVDVPALTGVLEGAHRPGHFAGVCRVVLKLFNLVRPDAAAFGTKDFQQLRVIEAMTAGLNLPVEILRGETVRDADGLAMSSRNRRLSAEDRARALAIPRALQLAAAGPVREAEATMRRELTALEVDYAAAVSPVTLRPVTHAPALLAVAARVGGVRLIDNALVEDD